jgi:peptide/nickel transport system permease protein
MLEVIRGDYIRTAYSKGLTEIQAIVKHALPNVLIPVVTLLSVYMRSIIGGLLLVEIVFGWPGVGRLFYQAVLQRDYPVIQGVALIIAIAIYVTNMIVDLLYAYLDPRIRVEAKLQ